MHNFLADLRSQGFSTNTVVLIKLLNKKKIFLKINETVSLLWTYCEGNQLWGKIDGFMQRAALIEE